MLKNIKKISSCIVFFTILFSFFSLSGCNPTSGGVEGPTAALTSVSITPSATSMAATGSVSLTAEPVVTGTPSVTYTWQITGGSDYATLTAATGKSVTLNGENATFTNQSVTVKLTASYNGVEKTATTTITVAAKIPDPEITSVSISGTTAIEAAGTGSLTAIPGYTGEIASSITYVWSITNGSEYASVSGNSTTATITGKNTDTQAHDVTVQVAATYNGVTKTAVKTLTVAAAEVIIPDELTSASLASSAASVAPDGTVTITPAAEYTGSLTESDFTVSGWTITEGADYAVLKVPSSGSSRSSISFTGCKYNSTKPECNCKRKHQLC